MRFDYRYRLWRGSARAETIPGRVGRTLALLGAMGLGCGWCAGQTPVAGLAPTSDVPAELASLPLPAVDALMHLVEEHQKASEATIRNYIYTATLQGLKLDGRGDTRRATTTEREVFYVDGVQLHRVIRRDGKELSAEEQAKERERIDREIAKERERGGGKDDARKDEISFARFLELGSFSNERRVMLRGRSTIALDYAGDPRAKTRNALEGAVHDMEGTVWVDEEDAAVSRVEGHFARNFKVGAGLVANVAKDTSFVAESARVNGEVWLPSAFSAQGSMHVLLFFSFNGRVSGTNTNYRRFKTNTKILPGVQEVETTGTEGVPPEGPGGQPQVQGGRPK